MFQSSYCSLIFELKPAEKRCYIDELFDNSVLMIRWKIFKDKSKDVDEYIKYIEFTITNEDTNKVELTFKPPVRKGKTTFSPKKEGAYRICALYSGKVKKGDRLYMNIKFGSDNMDEPKLADAVKSTDINKMEVKADDLLELAKPIIDRQKKEAERENLSSKKTLYNTRWYKRVTFAQILLCIIIGTIQLNNFRKFLKSQNII